MPLTTLDTVASLVVIDLQKFVLSMPTAHPVGEIINRAAQLVSAFRERGLPVVLVRVTGAYPGGRTESGVSKTMPPGAWSELIPEMEPQPGDLVICKPRADAFIGTSLEYDLRQRGVTQVFLAGIATSIGVESAVRSASGYGYNVVSVVDAMTDRDAAAHSHSIEKIFPRLSEIAKTDDVLKLLKESPVR